MTPTSPIWLDVAMTRVKIAELKDQLSRYIRAAEAGAEITVTDRDRPVARIVPVPSPDPEVSVIPPKRDFAELRDLPRERVDLGISSTELLLRERGER